MDAVIPAFAGMTVAIRGLMPLLVLQVIDPLRGLGLVEFGIESLRIVGLLG
jgi:hypothetical protein